MNTAVGITELQPAIMALRDNRLMMRDGAYLIGGRDRAVAQQVVEQMMRDDIIQRVGSGIYELTQKGKQMARNGGGNAIPAG